MLPNDDIHRHVTKLSGHITRISGLQRSIGQSLSGSVGTNEILKNRKPLTEAGGNRTFDDFTGRLGHQSAHARQLTNLITISSRT